MTTAIYPGSFDPITLGHLDILNRALKVFDQVRVLVAHNAKKRGLFGVEERAELIRASVGGDPRVTVDTFEGLLVDYAKAVGQSVVMIRGLRAVTDFEYEFQMANMNRHLYAGMETIFLMTGSAHHFVSSSVVREVACLGGDIGDLVPPPVAAALRARFAQPEPGRQEPR